MMQNREITDDKLEQNEELALLRAKTSIEKQKCLIMQKLKSDINEKKRR